MSAEHLTAGQRAVIALIKMDGDPVTRESYIAAAYGGDMPDPWTAEDEAELPEELQDWSQFEGMAEDAYRADQPRLPAGTPTRGNIHAGEWTKGSGGEGGESASNSPSPEHWLVPAVRYGDKVSIGRNHEDAVARVPLEVPSANFTRGYVNENGEWLSPSSAATYALARGLTAGGKSDGELDSRRFLQPEHLDPGPVDHVLKAVEAHEAETDRQVHTLNSPETHVHAHYEPNTQAEGRAPAQLSWEAAPGMTTSIFPEFHNAPLEQRQEFQDAIQSVLTTPEGQDVIAKEMGLVAGQTFAGAGAFQGRVNPGAQSQVSLNSFHLSPRDIQLLNATEAIRGMLLHQDAAAWHRPAFDAERFQGPYLLPAIRGKSGRYWLGRTHNEAYASMPADERVNLDRRQDWDAFRFMDDKGQYLTRDEARPYAEQHGLLNKHGAGFKQRDLIAEHLTDAATAPADRLNRDDANMLDFRVGRPLTQDETARVAEQLSSVAGGFFSPIATPKGFRLLNVPEVTGIDNRAFHALIVNRLDQMEAGTLPVAIETHLARADSGYLENDWKEHPNGEGYLHAIDSAGPYVQGVAHKVVTDLEPKIDAVCKDFAQRYGWTGWPPGGEAAGKGRDRAIAGDASMDETATLSFLRGLNQLAKRDPQLAQDTIESLARSLALDAYNPNEPRAPAGTREGGQWTKGGYNPSSAPQSAPAPAAAPAQAHPAAAGAPQPYPAQAIAAKLMDAFRDRLPKTPEEMRALGDQIAAQYGLTETIHKIDEMMRGETPTNALVKDGGYKVDAVHYTPERTAWHREKLREIFTHETVARCRAKPGERPVMTVLGGRGGSGKSFLTSEGGPVDVSRALVLDADVFKAMLPEFKGWNAGTVHEESSDLLEMAVEIARRMRLNVVVDETLKSPGKAERRIAPFQKAGYEIQGHYMFCAPEVAAARSMQRYVNGLKKDGKGRLVPPEIILQNQKNEENFDRVLPAFTKWSVWSNMGNAPVMVARKEDR